MSGETQDVWLTEQEREWKADAERYPSGRRCDGIHDATPDRRILVLLARVAAERERANTIARRLQAENDEEDTMSHCERCGAQTRPDYALVNTGQGCQRIPLGTRTCTNRDCVREQRATDDEAAIKRAIERGVITP